LAQPLNSRSLNQLALKLFTLVKPFVFPALMLAYILGDAYVIAFKKFYIYPYNAIPVLLFIIYQAIFHLQNLVYFLAFFTPLAISLKEMGLTQGPDLSIPTEPVMAGIMLVYMLSALKRPLTDVSFRHHPVSYLIYFQLAWMFITCFTSTDVIVSVKYIIARLWFIFSCYIIIPHLFKDKKNIINFVFAYASALAIVVCYTIVVHAGYNFNDKAADWVVSPFYNDHTAYGAALAMFIPLMAGFLFMKTVSKKLKIFALGLLLLFLLGIVLSFARAGWLSLAIICCMLVTIYLGIRFQNHCVYLVGWRNFVFQFSNRNCVGT
jgi:putative inorganic carbon (HCO3(-)) transporter